MNANPNTISLHFHIVIQTDQSLADYVETPDTAFTSIYLALNKIQQQRPTELRDYWCGAMSESRSADGLVRANPTPH